MLPGFATVVRLLMRSSPKLNVIRGYSANDISATVGPMSISRADTREKKPSFTKNLFLGKFDTDMLTFPESLDSEKLAAVKKNAMILKNIMNTESSAIDKSRQIIREVYGMTSSGFYTADGLKAIECVQLFESISSNPSVSLLLEQHYSVILKTIKKYGNPAMKTMYYSRLLSGECFAACALAEEIAGFDPTCIRTSAVFDIPSGKWKLNGEKVLVLNANSSAFFIVFAQTQLPSMTKTELSAFIVAGNTAGMMIKAQDTLGLEDCNLCRVTFNDLLISEDNILGGIGKGYEIASCILHSHKFLIASCVSGNLIQVLSTVTSHLRQQQRPVNHFDSELTMKILADTSTVSYALDSMIYLTAGLIDQYNIDTSLESSIVQIYSFERGLKHIYDCLEIFRVLCYDKKVPHGKLFNNLRGIPLNFANVSAQKLFISLIGLQHAGKHLVGHVTKLRNPLSHPSHSIKELIFGHLRASTKWLNLELYVQLHPTLKNAAEQLEYCVHRFKYTVEVILFRFGTESVHRHLDLLRLSDVLIDVYLMTSVLSRASRAYCSGIKNSDQEIILAKTICEDAHHRIKLNIKLINEERHRSNDISKIKIGQSTFVNGGCLIDHPLGRN